MTRPERRNGAAGARLDRCVFLGVVDDESSSVVAMVADNGVICWMTGAPDNGVAARFNDIFGSEIVEPEPKSVL